MSQELIAKNNVLEFGVADSPLEETSVWSSLRNWWLLIPLVYFGTNGALLVQSEFASGEAFSGPTASESLMSRGIQAAVWLVGLLLMYPYYRSIARAVRENKAISALFGYTVISIAWSPFFLDSLRRAILLSLTVCFAYFLIQRFRPSELMQLIYFTGCISVLGSLVCVALFPAYGLMPTGEWQGIFGHKNDLGIFLCFMLSPALFTPARASIATIAKYTCGLLGIVLIIGSQSRGAWVVAAALFVYAAVSQLIRRVSSTREAVGLTAAIVGIGAVLGALVYANYAAITYMMGKDPTLTNRGRIWAAVLAAISKHPVIGYGYGGFWNGLRGDSRNIIAAVGINITHAHNGYLNLTVQMGLIGLSLFLFALLVGVKNAITALYSHRSRVALWYGGILLMTVVASSDESFLMNYNALTTILFIVACVGLRKIAIGEEVE